MKETLPMYKTNGDVVFGLLNEKKKKIVSMPDRDWSKGTDYNRNIAVCDPPGTGTTRAFVMNNIISKLSAGESLYVVDTKGEIYAKTCSFAKAQGYEVKILNLIETGCSDGWDVLGEVENDPEMAMELAATVIRNTGGAKTDPFWNDAEMNILKAVILLKSVGEADISNRTGKKQTFGDVYRYVATRKLSYKEGGAESMEADFRFLREYMPNHPAVTPFLQFQNAGDDVCKKILHGLANRLQLFQNEQLSKVLGTKDIDLIKSGSSKCIYYLRFSDQTSSSTGRRYVKTTDEIRRLDKKNLLVFVRDRNVIELRKMDYTENPIYKANKSLFAHEASVADHVTKVEKADVNYDSFRFSDIDRSRFVSNMSGRAENRSKSGPEPNSKHHTTEYRPPLPRSRGPRGL